MRVQVVHHQRDPLAIGVDHVSTTSASAGSELLDLLKVATLVERVEGNSAISRDLSCLFESLITHLVLFQGSCFRGGLIFWGLVSGKPAVLGNNPFCRFFRVF